VNIAEALSEKIGPAPAWMLALIVGGGLYWLARRRSSPATLAPAPASGLPCEQCGTPAAFMGPALQPNPVSSSGINTQPGAALAPGSIYVPTVIPAVSGGDAPFIGGYAGLRRATPYDYARGGPS
jgi:hypothetical protein